MQRLLRELRANITPRERENIGLPSSVMRILPGAEGGVSDLEAPIQADCSRWQRTVDPERLVRSFKFSDYSELITFVNDVLTHQYVTRHTGELTIRANEVLIKVWTKDIDRVTELDLEYTKTVGEIYQDVHFKHKGLR